MYCQFFTVSVSLGQVQQPGVRRSARREPVSYDLPDETPAYHSDAIRLLPALQQPSKTEVLVAKYYY